MITSISNPKIKTIMNLQKKTKFRKEQDLFIIEGIKMFQEIPDNQLVTLFISESLKNGSLYHEHFDHLPHEVVTDKVFESISDTQTPQGILAIVKQSHYTLADIISQNSTPHMLIIEDIQDPGNLGTIFRSGEAAGVTGIIMSKGTADLYNPKVVRSTMGSIYRVPFIYTEDLKEIIPTIKPYCTIYASHLKGSQNYDQCDFKTGTAILIGNEAKGLSDSICEMADILVKIPMKGQVESLNAAIASAIFMFEVSRQRRIY